MTVFAQDGVLNQSLKEKLAKESLANSNPTPYDQEEREPTESDPLLPEPRNQSINI